MTNLTPNPDTSARLDYAIAGGGVSGLYTAWRLLADAAKKKRPQPKITIYESSAEIGGRLLTWLPLGQDSGLRAELGGMRFMKSQQLVWSLLHDGGLGFTSEDIIDFPVSGDHWRLLLRGQSIGMPKTPHAEDWERASERYHFDDDEAERHKQSPGDIVAEIFTMVLEQNDISSAPTTREGWDAIKPELTWYGKPLWDIGFWNLLSDECSPETYQYIVDAFGYFSIASNWNAAEAMQTIMLDFRGEDFYTLKNGYMSLPTYLAKALEHKVEIQRSTRLATFSKRADDALELVLVGPTGRRFTATADRLVLAMPRRALELISTPASLFDIPGKRYLKRLVTSVTPIPAFKLFLFYKDRWWQELEPPMTVGRSVCDLPIRQTYYMRPDDLASTTAGLIMASYDDARAVDYWQGLVPRDDQLAEGRLQLLEALAAFAQVLGADMTGVEQREPPPHLHKAPEEMVNHARRQLARLHDIPPESVPQPEIGAFADWGLDPFGGGWNFWTAQTDVREVMTQIKTPLGADERVYIVGDGYSGVQGWVEGALTATEVVLTKHLGAERPEWLPEDYYLGW
ncbi:MAG: hypothetical protein QOD83_1187 [Solirubrobacteraceae bacterium]|jgi:monoamine oxidase|nr:hypothetical protein [Solirubrobacteraceae bacterium]